MDHIRYAEIYQSLVMSGMDFDEARVEAYDLMEEEDVD